MSKEQQYIDMYKQMHETPTAFPGKTVYRHKDLIKSLVEEYSCSTLLDYGCGKGIQYTSDNPYGECLWQYWRVDVTRYDPAVPEFDKLPEEPRDMVICTDVLEHIPEEGLNTAIHNLIRLSDRCLFITIAMEPALAVLPNGDNAHCSLYSEEWWLDKFSDTGVPTTIVFSYHKSEKEHVVSL